MVCTLVSPQRESDRDRHAFISRCQRSTKKPLPISRFFIQGSSSSSCNRLLRSLGKAPSKRSSRLTAAARSFLRDFTIFILYLIYRHQIFCASSASARASLRAAAFSFSITAWKEKTSSLMTGARTRMEIRFGIAMRAFAISERFQTRSRV